MPSPSQTPAILDASTGDTPVVHLTRRERIAAERAAAKQGLPTVASTSVTASATAMASDSAAVDETLEHVAAQVDEVAAQFDDAAAWPVTPAAPASPVLPESSVTPATPPAPTSPVVAEAVDADAAAEPVVPFDDLVGIDGAPTTTTIPVVLATDEAPVTEPVRRRDMRPARPQRATRAERRAQRADQPARPARAASTARTTPSGRTARTADTRGSSFRRNASRATAVGAVLFTAGLVVSTSLPAQALWTAQDAETVNVAAKAAQGQTMSVGDAAPITGMNRDAYTVSELKQYQNTDSTTFSNDPAGTIQWPFLTGVPITSGFGGRNVAGCSFCSTNHMGVDFAPGEGTPIRVIAAGKVIKVQAYDGGYGNDVWVQHDVDGKEFVSVYGHMEDNSFAVVQGQDVNVGDVLGKVGSTGNSTGPHLHLEIHVNDVPVDPLAWLKANAN